MKKSPVVHFEMPAKDLERVKKFYTEAFGWDMVQYGPEMGNYVVAQTVETDDKGMPQQPGAINGGFWVPDENTPVQPPHVVIAVENIEETVETIKNAGGEIQGVPMDIPGVGNYVSIKDTEGNIVGVLQPVPME